MTRHAVYCLPINPEPWAIGNAFVARGKGKAHAAIAPNKTLKAYQEAVRAELLARGATMVDGPYMLTFWFWRENVTYTDAGGRKRTRNSPDLTNMVKATEDALQGIVIDNDSHVVATHQYVVERGRDVDPMIVVEVEQATEDGWADTLTPAAQYAIEREKAAADRLAQRAVESNLWTPGT